jgi:hypothetical protein
MGEIHESYFDPVALLAEDAVSASPTTTAYTAAGL